MWPRLWSPLPGMADKWLTVWSKHADGMDVAAAVREGYKSPRELREALERMPSLLGRVLHLERTGISSDTREAFALHDRLIGIPRPRLQLRCSWASFDEGADDEAARGHGPRVREVLGLATPEGLHNYLSMIAANWAYRGVEELCDLGVCKRRSEAIALCRQLKLLYG